MEERTSWTLKSLLFAIAFTIIAIPIWIIIGPFFLICKLLEIILQPYLLRKAKKEFNEAYIENLKKGIWIDYPPTWGSLTVLLPLKWRMWLIDQDDNEEEL